MKSRREFLKTSAAAGVASLGAATSGSIIDCQGFPAMGRQILHGYPRHA